MIPVVFADGRQATLDLRCAACGCELTRVERVCFKKVSGAAHLHVKCLNVNCLFRMPDHIKEWAACVGVSPT